MLKDLKGLLFAITAMLGVLIPCEVLSLWNDFTIFGRVTGILAGCGLLFFANWMVKKPPTAEERKQRQVEATIKGLNTEEGHLRLLMRSIFSGW